MVGAMKTVDDLIAAMGGTSQMAKQLGVGPSTVSNWRAAGVIPARRYAQIEYEVDDVPMELFDFA